MTIHLYHLQGLYLDKKIQKFLNYKLKFKCVCTCSPAHLAPKACESPEATREHQTPWKVPGGCEACHVGAETESWSSVRAANVLYHWTISPVPKLNSKKDGRQNTVPHHLWCLHTAHQLSILNAEKVKKT